VNTTRLAVGFVVVVLAFVVVRLLLVEPVVVRQLSMEPTLVNGDTALVSKWCRWAGTWGRGDVVAVRSPADGGLLVKRIVATAGQRVGLRDGRLAVDGRAAPPGADFEAVDGTYFGPVRVPTGAVFVMGDNRARSVDSRVFGSVDEDDVVGCVVAVAWPPSHAQLLRSAR
jgi:signal peptidase I